MTDPDGERRSLSRGEWAAVILAVVVVAATAWIWLRRPGTGEPPAQGVPVAAQQQSDLAREAQPSAEVSDPQARQNLQSVSDHPAFRRWLEGVDDVVRRWATITDNLAEGVSPRKWLGPAGPKAPFRAVQRQGKTFIAPESYARYDEFAGVVSSVNAQAFAGVYRALRPAVEVAYRALGYPEGSLDDATARAFRRLEAAPAVSGEVELVQDRSVYRFVDPELEGQRQVEKHLLRMGPRNTRLIQAKARQLRETLQLPE